MRVRRLATGDPGFERALETLLAFEAAQDPAVENATAEILDAVRTRGDAALLELTSRFDRWTPASASAREGGACEPRERRARSARVRGRAHSRVSRAPAAGDVALRRTRRHGPRPEDHAARSCR